MEGRRGSGSVRPSRTRRIRDGSGLESRGNGGDILRRRWSFERGRDEERGPGTWDPGRTPRVE